MKKILYGIFALILCSNVTFGQVPLMSDEAHRIMMNDYATNLNTILTAECPQGITIDQFKKKIVNGELTLSSTAQTSILTYAEPLKTYGTQFATNNNLTAITDAEKIFLSSFAPSTLIQNGKLITITAIAGPTATEMWDCALASFNTSDCGISGLVSDKSDIMLLDKTVSAFLSNQGVLIMLNGFNECRQYSTNKNLMKGALDYSVKLAINNIVSVNNLYYIDKNSFITGVVTLMNKKLNDNFQISDIDVFAGDFNPNLSDMINDIDNLAYLNGEQKIVYKDFAYAIGNAASDEEILKITSRFSKNVAQNSGLNSQEKENLYLLL